ncbi:MAG: monodechloroaminopyrrolnitrin synthase PrnB family protein [Reichenbachiella sp.]|uniref:monodechloroaminopyrrolnitrin synthase PrnB family protein n=1 Tax=Reichenbachiella sp. TaxID=2184521 RepID=UPI003297685D
MKQTDLMKDEWCHIWYDSELNAIGANWQGFPKVRHVRESCEFMSSFIKENNVKHHYSNQLNLKVLSKEVGEYLNSDWFPNVEKLGLERIAVLVSFDPYVKAAMNKVNKSYLGNGDLEIFTFGLEKECLNWLKVSRSPIDETQQLVNKISAFQMLKVEEEVKKLDPLGIDEYVSLIPKLNADGDADGLVSLLSRKLPTPEQLDGFDFYTSLASMRDIGIFLGSIKRHDIEPIEAIPHLEYVLDELSRKTNLPPRDTLLHYTVWNPDGHRKRRYTSVKDELDLMHSVTESFPAMEGAIDHLIKLHHTPIDSPYYEELCEKAGADFKHVIQAIVFAHRTVSPEFFARELRFYYDPIVFNNEELIGPGAVELPMFVYDHLLWSSQIMNEEYVEFKTKYLPFNLSFMRDIYDFYSGKESLVDVAIRMLEEKPNDQVVASSQALLKLCNMQKSFRMPHKKLAEESYKYQEETGQDKGSGGYSTDILQFILEANSQRIDSLSSSINKLTQIKETN